MSGASKPTGDANVRGSLGRPPRHRTSSDLGTYIMAALTDAPSAGEQIFDYGICHSPPRLSKHRKNRLLLYPGAFNPPHRGHERLLCHAFANTRDINVIAAIILPLDDCYVRAKCGGAENSLLLTKRQRAKLWLGFGSNDWYWVYERSEQDWHSFRFRLIKAASESGFVLSFILLVGPDYICRKRPPPWQAWDCDEMVVSDVSRLADISTPSGRLLTLKECEPWQQAESDDNAIMEYARRTIAIVYGAMPVFTLSSHNSLFWDENMERESSNLLEDLRRKRDAVKICRREGNASQTVRFIPAGGTTNYISSTYIRRLIDGQRDGSLIESLRGMALNPEMLLEYL